MNEKEFMPESMGEQQVVRMEKAKKLKEKGIEPFGKRYDVENKICDLIQQFKDTDKEILHDLNYHVKIAGRLMAKRDKGKIAFINVEDRDGNIQVYIKKDIIGEESFEIFKLSDIGDIIGIEGIMMKTNTGELTIKCEHYTHLTKALRPLPGKISWINHIEERYRRRYLDLIANRHAKRSSNLSDKNYS